MEVFTAQYQQRFNLPMQAFGSYDAATTPATAMQQAKPHKLSVYLRVLVKIQCQGGTVAIARDGTGNARIVALTLYRDQMANQPS